MTETGSGRVYVDKSRPIFGLKAGGLVMRGYYGVLILMILTHTFSIK